MNRRRGVISVMKDRQQQPLLLMYGLIQSALLVLHSDKSNALERRGERNVAPS